MTVLERLSTAVDALFPGRRVLVAIDGPDAAGKSTLAGQLRQHLCRSAVSVSIDGWHHPREYRTRRGNESPDGYFQDSFDLQALALDLLDPFRSGADTVRTACYDHVSDRPVKLYAKVAPTAALIFDGVFLLRPELRPFWDLTVYLHVPEAVTLQRALYRDAALLGGEANVRRRYENRYLPAQQLYRQSASPLETADIVIDNSDPPQARVLRWAGDQ